MKKKFILGISGSPRKGNTETIIDNILKGAKDQGAKVEKIVLNTLSINYCQACYECSDNGCIHDDDMNQIIERIIQSDLLVLGTPVYWWGPTAQFKTFMDRWIAVKGMFQGKKVILVITLGAKSSHHARHTIGMLEDSLSYVSAEIIDTMVVTGTTGKNYVLNEPSILKKAIEKGKKAMSTLEETLELID